ncbi:hypothetical protein ACH427_02825 [Streptomyces sp. NPDC020379]|uniref:AMP-binding enzyme n=1 Tax=Streptomyces sp. NPDC020379 TaxID=3365071 RepID=UPI00378E0B60
MFAHPGRAAIVDPADATRGTQRREWAYGELDGRAVGFLAEGIRKGDRVAFQLPSAAEHVFARPAAVVPVPGACLGERARACVVPRAGAVPLKSLAVEKFVRERGPAAYKIPGRAESVERLPRTGIGEAGEKDLRAAVPASLAAVG